MKDTPVLIMGLWIILWSLLAASGGLVLVAVGHWVRSRLRHGHHPPSGPLPAIAPMFLAAQARIGRLKRQDRDARADAAMQPPDRRRATAASVRRAPWYRALLDGIRQSGGAVVAWLGWPGAIIALLVVSGALGGLIWQAQRHPPVPPGAQAVQETIVEGFARLTAYRVPWMRWRCVRFTVRRSHSGVGRIAGRRQRQGVAI